MSPEKLYSVPFKLLLSKKLHGVKIFHDNFFLTTRKVIFNKVYSIFQKIEIKLFFILLECLVCDSSHDFMECINPNGVAGKSRPCTRSTSDCYSRVIGKSFLKHFFY